MNTNTVPWSSLFFLPFEYAKRSFFLISIALTTEINKISTLLYWKIKTKTNYYSTRLTNKNEEKNPIIRSQITSTEVPLKPLTRICDLLNLINKTSNKNTETNQKHCNTALPNRIQEMVDKNLPPLSISAPNTDLAVIQSRLLRRQLLPVHLDPGPGAKDSKREPVAKRRNPRNKKKIQNCRTLKYFNQTNDSKFCNYNPEELHNYVYIAKKNCLF